MRRWPKITIITPSYNQGAFIERTIQSVLSQKYPNLEYIIMDGGSTDSTKRVLRKYRSQLVWFSEKDQGQADAINKGLRYSTGEILAYLNSDDTYEPGVLRKIALYFLRNRKASFVYGRGKLIDAHEHRLGMYNDSAMDLEKLFGCCGISQPTTFWRREVYRVVGEFNTTLQYTMDYDYWIRVAKHFQLHFLPKMVVANTRIHLQAKTSRATHLLHWDAVRTTLHHYGKVHVDWINTLADGNIHYLKSGNIISRQLYWVSMIVKTTYYHLVFNHSLPPNLQLRYFWSWIKESK